MKPIPPEPGNAFALCSVALPDAPPVLFVGVGENLHILDQWSDSPTVYDVIYTTRPAIWGKPGRNDRERAKRAVLFGEAENIVGTITFFADNLSESYEIVEVYDIDKRILVWQECSEEMAGVVLYCTIHLTEAVGLTVRDFRMEGELLG